MYQQKKKQMKKLKKKKTVTSKVYTIMSLDGGGVRGIFGMEFMKLLIEDLQKRHKKTLHELIDLYCGVSVGSIMATLLAQHKYKFFSDVAKQEKLLAEVFAQKTMLGPAIECKYRGEPKRLAIIDTVGQDTMKDVKSDLMILVSDMKGKEIIAHSNVAVASASQGKNKNQLGRGFVKAKKEKKTPDAEQKSKTVPGEPADILQVDDTQQVSQYSQRADAVDSKPSGKKVTKPDYKDVPTVDVDVIKRHQDVPLWKMVDASTAAPIYFPPVKVFETLCIDGGAISTDPSILGVHTMRKIVSQNTTHDSSSNVPRVRVISIGAGSGNMTQDASEVSYERDPMQYGAITWMTVGFVDLITKSNDELLQSVMPAFLGGPNRYLRVDTTVKVAMDDGSPESQEQLRKNAKETFKQHGNAIVEWLLHPN